LPQDDLLNVKFTDTLTVFSKTLADTFLRTDKLSKNYLGVINDPLFGFQKASIAVELDRPNDVYDDTLMTSYTVDSVVLFLKYSYIYGDTTVPQSFDVSTISNKIIETSPYYSNSSLFPPTGIIGSVSNYLFTPTTNPVATSRTDTGGVTGILRIKINNSVGNTILDLKQTILRDSSLFKNAFPGILIENATNAGKAMAEIDISSGFSALAIFYKDKNGDAKDMKLFTSILNYNTGSNSTRVNGVNLFTNSFASAVQNTVASGLESDSVNYVLGQAGTLLRISLPTLNNVGRVAVNKATILLSQIQANTSPLTTPFYLVLLKRNAAGNIDILPTGDGVGILDTTTTDDFGNKVARYSFNVSKYIQAVATGNESNSDLYVATYRFTGTDRTVNILNSIVNGSVLNIGFTPSRIIVAGANYSDPRYKLKLNLTYTKID
ncbi:MAG: DUF4270 family protein, partial [Chitinophagales bacterium]|nr:DUF4270 family protein [Chitinophagales bacterium]